MKKWILSLLALVGCSGESPAYKAWHDEARSRGHNNESLRGMIPGKVVKYSCGCEWTVTAVGGVFGNLPCPPPVRCHHHNRPIVGCKFPEEWEKSE